MINSTRAVYLMGVAIGFVVGFTAATMLFT